MALLIVVIVEEGVLIAVLSGHEQIGSPTLIHPCAMVGGEVFPLIIVQRARLPEEVSAPPRLGRECAVESFPCQA
jgi:hypothetical protein